MNLLDLIRQSGGAFNKADEFMQKPGGNFLMNLLAQDGYSTMPGSPLGAVGKAGLMTQQQQQAQGMADLNKRLLESQIGLNQARAQNPYTGNKPKPPASIAEYQLYEQQTLQAGLKPVSFDSWVKEMAKLRATGTAEGKREVSSPAETAVDQSYAPTYVEWSQNGRSDAMKGLSQLEDAANRITQSNVSGGWMGVIPDGARPYIAPESADVKELIEEVVQRNLRLILGAQFTEKEGERLIARAYNVKLPEEKNAERLRRLRAQMALAVQAKDDQARYYEQNGTLQGWQGKTYTIDDFNKIFDDGGSSESTPKRVKVDANGNIVQ